PARRDLAWFRVQTAAQARCSSGSPSYRSDVLGCFSEQGHDFRIFSLGEILIMRANRIKERRPFEAYHLIAFGPELRERIRGSHRNREDQPRGVSGLERTKGSFDG